MKIIRICLVSVVLVLTGSVAMAQTGSSKAKNSSASSLSDAIIATETKIIEAIKARDKATFVSMVDQDGYAIDWQGIRKISEVTSALFSPDLTFTQYTIDQPMVTMLDANTALIMYTSTATVTMGGKSMTGTSYESSVFVRKKGKWIGTFHQSSEKTSPMAPVSSGN